MSKALFEETVDCKRNGDMMWKFWNLNGFEHSIIHKLENMLNLNDVKI